MVNFKPMFSREKAFPMLMVLILFQAVKLFMVNYRPMVSQEKAFPMLMVQLVSQYKKCTR